MKPQTEEQRLDARPVIELLYLYVAARREQGWKFVDVATDLKAMVESCLDAVYDETAQRRA